jgi:hypothetical protein
LQANNASRIVISSPSCLAGLLGFADRGKVDSATHDEIGWEASVKSEFIRKIQEHFMHLCFNSRHSTIALVAQSLLWATSIAVTFSIPCLASGPTLEWVQQFGTPLTNDAGIDGDSVQGLSLDGLGHLYLSGTTWGNLGGPNAGRDDAYVSKFDVDGSRQWIRQSGTSTNDHGVDVSADQLGNVFLTTFHGGVGPFLRNLDADGNELWNRQGVGSDGVSADRSGCLRYH